MDSNTHWLKLGCQFLAFRAAHPNAVLLPILIVVAGFLSVALGQDANWDLQNYHIYNAFAFFHHRHGLDIGATAQWYFNPAPDLFYYLLIHFFLHHPKIVAFIQGGQAAILWFMLWLLFEQASHLTKINKWAARLAWVAACSGSVLVSEIGTTFNDIPQTYLTIAGLYFLSKYLTGEPKPRNLYIGFFLFGLATGFKLTSAVFIVAAAITLLIVDRSIRGILLAILFGTAGVLASGGWWFLHLSLEYQNPFFPYFNNIFHSPWWSSETMTDTRFFPRSALQWIAYPAFWLAPNHDLVTEVNFADGRVLAGLICTLGCLVRLATKASATPPLSPNPFARKYICAMAIFFLVSYLLWLRMFSIYRYAMPLESLSPLMLMAFFFGFKTEAGEPLYRKILVTLFAIALLSIMLTTRYPDWMRAPYSNTVLSAQTALDTKGATVIGGAGDPPISYVFASMPDADHFVTIASSDLSGTRMFKRVNSILANSDKIYVLYQENKNPQILTEAQRDFGLSQSPGPCTPVRTNLGGDFVACKFQRRVAAGH